MSNPPAAKRKRARSELPGHHHHRELEPLREREVEVLGRLYEDAALARFAERALDHHPIPTEVHELSRIVLLLAERVERLTEAVESMRLAHARE